MEHSKSTSTGQPDGVRYVASLCNSWQTHTLPGEDRRPVFMSQTLECFKELGSRSLRNTCWERGQALGLGEAHSPKGSPRSSLLQPCSETGEPQSARVRYRLAPFLCISTWPITYNWVQHKQGEQVASYPSRPLSQVPYRPKLQF